MSKGNGDDQSAISDQPSADAGEIPMDIGMPQNADTQRLPVPAGYVVVRKVRGPEGIHHAAGFVVLGGLYTVAITVAVAMTTGKAAEFEPATEADRAAIEAARKAPEK